MIFQKSMVRKVASKKPTPFSSGTSISLDKPIAIHCSEGSWSGAHVGIKYGAHPPLNNTLIKKRQLFPCFHPLSHGVFWKKNVAVHASPSAVLPPPSTPGSEILIWFPFREREAWIAPKSPFWIVFRFPFRIDSLMSNQCSHETLTHWSTRFECFVISLTCVFATKAKICTKEK